MILAMCKVPTVSLYRLATAFEAEVESLSSMRRSTGCDFYTNGNGYNPTKYQLLNGEGAPQNRNNRINKPEQVHASRHGLFLINKSMKI